MIFNANDLQDGDELLEALGQGIVQAFLQVGKQAYLNTSPDCRQIRCYNGHVSAPGVALFAR
jgi:hypothetical protein